MDQKNRQAGKRELFLTGAVLLTALLFFLVNRAFHSGPAAFLEISVDGTVVETLELHKDQEYTVKNDQGGVNVFVIRDGKPGSPKPPAPIRSVWTRDRSARRER